MEPATPDADHKECDCDRVRLKYISMMSIVLAFCSVVLLAVVISRQSEIMRIHESVEAVILKSKGDHGALIDTLRHLHGEFRGERLEEQNKRE